MNPATKQKLYGAIAIVVAIGLLWAWATSPSDKKKGVAPQAAAAAVAPLSTTCPNVRTSVRFASSKQDASRLNPGGNCAIDLWNKKCLWLQQAESTTLRKHCDGPTPPDVEWVWSAEGEFEGGYALAPPRRTVLFEFRQ